MKAKEYFEKFEAKIMNECSSKEAVFELLKAMSEEACLIMRRRRCESVDAIAAVIREMNGRWNALHRMFQKKYGGLSPIKPDGFKNYWLYKVPEMAKHLNPREP